MRKMLISTSKLVNKWWRTGAVFYTYLSSYTFVLFITKFIISSMESVVVTDTTFWGKLFHAAVFLGRRNILLYCLRWLGRSHLTSWEFLVFFFFAGQTVWEGKSTFTRYSPQTRLYCREVSSLAMQACNSVRWTCPWQPLLSRHRSWAHLCKQNTERWKWSWVAWQTALSKWRQVLI